MAFDREMHFFAQGMQDDSAKDFELVAMMDKDSVFFVLAHDEVWYRIELIHADLSAYTPVTYNEVRNAHAIILWYMETEMRARASHGNRRSVRTCLHT